VARSPTPGPGGIFWIEFTGDDGSSQRLIAPPPLPSSAGPILSRNEKLVSVTTPDAETMRAALPVALLMLGASSRSDAIDYVALCQSSVQGTKIWISSTPPAAALLG